MKIFRAFRVFRGLCLSLADRFFSGYFPIRQASRILVSKWLQTAWIGNLQAIGLNSGVFIGSWLCMLVERHLERLAAMMIKSQKKQFVHEKHQKHEKNQGDNMLKIATQRVNRENTSSC
ncbi:hypothetical protein [Propionivibrio sp.]|uniref:hypothetical protein n=1 Tax=Propionivibrio sp. TaxID=2212460 RepID=UPI003BF06AE6